ncbi:MAG: PqiC family protein [Thermodesulfobacteriota bacterium]|jgi:uncharacterized lipoprotein YmbA|nr:MAG: PqiC family protein [Thermodesulfobacteriota bacterium]
MIKRLLSLVIFCALAEVMMGCASTPSSQFYTLSSGAKPAAGTASYSISVGPVTVPAVVDRPQIVLQTGANQVTFDEFNRWAAPLQSEIARVVAENLASALGTPSVTVFPQSSAADASYRVVIDTLRFESVPGEAATLDALWTVRARKENQSRAGRTTVRESVQASGYAALVAAHSRALVRLSEDIASVVRTFEQAAGK